MSNSVDNTSTFVRYYNAGILSHPWLVILVLLVITAVTGFYAQNYKVDASADSLVLEGDDDLGFFREVGKRYASEDYLIIAYQPKKGLLEVDSLVALDDLVDELEHVDGVSSVTSVLDVPLLYSPKVSITELSSEIKTLLHVIQVYVQLIIGHYFLNLEVSLWPPAIEHTQDLYVN